MGEEKQPIIERYHRWMEQSGMWALYVALLEGLVFGFGLTVIMLLAFLYIK